MLVGLFILFPGLKNINPIRTDTEKNKTDYFSQWKQSQLNVSFISISSSENHEEMSAEF